MLTYSAKNRFFFTNNALNDGFDILLIYSDMCRWVVFSKAYRTIKARSKKLIKFKSEGVNRPEKMIRDVRIERKCENFCPKPDNIGRKSGFFYVPLKYKKIKKRNIFRPAILLKIDVKKRAKISVKC